MSNSSESSGCSILFAILAIIFCFLMFSGSCSTSSEKSSTRSSSNTQMSTQSNAQPTESKSSSTDEDQKLKSTVIEDPDADLIAQPLPSNGEIMSGNNYGYAGIEVTTSNSHAFVKVKTTDGYTVASFFIQKYSTAEIYIDPGTYSVQFALGDGTWYGVDACFGSGTSYGEDARVTLGNGDIVSYTLKLSTNGNFSMKSLDPDDF